MSVHPIRMPIRLLQPKHIPKRLPKPPNPLLDIPQRRSRIRRAEEHSITILLTLGTEPRALHQQRAVRNNRLENLLLDVRAALRGVGRVLAVVDAHPVEHAGSGRRPRRDGLGHVQLAGVEEDVAARGVFGADVQQPVEVAWVAPLLV